MKVYRDISNVPFIKNAVVTIGTFDGVHLGHQQILRRLKQLASEVDGKTVVVSFNPHPRIVLFPGQIDLKLITTPEERVLLLEQAGIDILLEIPFTKEFSETTGEQFIDNILVKSLNTKHLVIGYDHHFGKDRKGSLEHLKKVSAASGFIVEEIPAKDVDDATVSSTKIRKALQCGDIKTANTNLGYSFFFSGTVINGDKIGRTLGFPTANLQVEDKYKIVPAHGVYACLVVIDSNTYKGMLSIGLRPTIDDHKEVLEVNILNFNGDLYGKHLLIEVKDWIREQKKFDSLDSLKEAIKQDQLEIEKRLAHEVLL